MNAALTHPDTRHAGRRRRRALRRLRIGLVGPLVARACGPRAGRPSASAAGVLGGVDSRPQTAIGVGGAPLHANEGGSAAAAPAATAADRDGPLRTSLATLLTRHILRDGELVLLILKPSLWFIVFTCMRFAGLVLFGVIAARLIGLPDRVANAVAELGLFAITGRLMWAVLQWMGRLYVLTDLRVVRLAGVFHVEIFDCPLRKIALTRVTRSFRERLWRLGSIEIQPADDADEPCAPTLWQTVRRPDEVHQTVAATIERAKQG